jgi:hypothetical protein
MRRDAARADFEPERPFVGMHDIQIGRLENNRLIGADTLFHQLLRAEVAPLLAHRADEEQADARRGQLGQHIRRERMHGCGGRPLLVARAAAVETALANRTDEGVDGHALDALGVEMRLDHQRPARPARAPTGYEIGPTRRQLMPLQRESTRRELIGEHPGISCFAAERGIRGQIRVDARHRDPSL